MGEPVEWLGNWHPLADQLGAAHGLAALGDVSASLQLPPVTDVGSLRCFLRDYQKQVLVPLEFPAIERAYGHTSRHEVRELIAFDKSLEAQGILEPFLEASRRVGQGELRRLAPLKDERIVRRYQDAVERGEAHAWHTIIYGLTLALYSMPLRQGLLGYGYQTTRGFIYSTAKSLRLSELDCRALLEELCRPLTGAVDAQLAPVPVPVG